MNLFVPARTGRVPNHLPAVRRCARTRPASCFPFLQFYFRFPAPAFRNRGSIKCLALISFSIRDGKKVCVKTDLQRSFWGYEPKTLCGDNETICYESVKQGHTFLPVNARLKA